MAKKKATATPDSQATAPAGDQSPENTRRNEVVAPPGDVEIKAPPKLEARTSMIDQLAAQTNKAHADESGDAFTPAPETPTAITEPELEPETASATPAPSRVKIKVDGQEMEVDQTQVLEAGIRTLQKDKAADGRLQLATERLRQAEEILSAAKNRGPSNADTDTDDEPPANADADVKTLARAIQFGTEGEVEQAVKTILDRSKRSPGASQTTPSVDDIVGQVNARIEFQSAYEAFKTANSDIMSDDRLRQMVHDEDARLVQEIREGNRDHMPYAERFAAAGSTVRAWRDSIAGKSDKPRVEVDPGKAGRKANAGSIPTAGARPSGSPTPPPPPQSTTSIVAQMRTARGQPN